MGTESDRARPPWATRLLAIAGYLGLIPLLRLLRVRRDDGFLRHHQAQGLTAFLLILLLLPIWPVYYSLEVWIVQRHLAWASTYHAAQTWLGIASLVGLGLWGLMTMVGAGTSLAGSTRHLPLVAGLARRPWLMRVALIGNSVVLAGVALVVVVSFHASSLARRDVGPAPVYYLYENRDYEPLGNWVQELFCYRLSLAAEERWGPGTVVVSPLTAENFRTALTHGRFVVLLGHGARGAVATTDGWSVWPDVPAPAATPGGEPRVVPTIGLVHADAPNTFAAPGKDLRFVYLSACDGGAKAAEWEQRFAPAEVVSFDRLSAGMEHLWWLWFDAPRQLREVR